MGRRTRLKVRQAGKEEGCWLVAGRLNSRDTVTLVSVSSMDADDERSQGFRCGGQQDRAQAGRVHIGSGQPTTL